MNFLDKDPGRRRNDRLGFGLGETKGLRPLSEVEWRDPHPLAATAGGGP